jgi:nitrate/nitrite-specific signal transduction histidine kinase
MTLREGLLQLAEEKCSVAQQAHDSVATALDKLSADLRRFEQELRVNGDWKEEVRRGLVVAPAPLRGSALPVPLRL